MDTVMASIESLLPPLSVGGERDERRYDGERLCRAA